MGVCGANNLRDNKRQKKKSKKKIKELMSDNQENSKNEDKEEHNNSNLNSNNFQNQDININANENKQSKLSEDELEKYKNVNTKLLVGNPKFDNDLNDNHDTINKSKNDIPNRNSNKISQNSDISFEKDKKSNNEYNNNINNTPYKLKTSLNYIGNEDIKENGEDYQTNYCLLNTKYPNNNGNTQYLNNVQKENEIKKNKKNYEDFNDNSTYFIGCPVCQMRIPKIETVDYDSNENDFIVIYICSCNIENNKIRKTYFKELLFEDEIKNICIKHNSEFLLFFCKDCNIQICNQCKKAHLSHFIEDKVNVISEDNVNKILKIAEENKKHFKGYNLIKKLYQNMIKNNKNSILSQSNNNKFNNNGKSKIIEEEKEVFISRGYAGYDNQLYSINQSQNKIEDNNHNIGDNMSENKIKQSKNISLFNNEIKDSKRENNNVDLNNNSYLKINCINKNNMNNYNINDSNYVNNHKYKCIKTLEGHENKIVSLIQLNSGNIATGSYDYSVRIWDIEKWECILLFYEIGYVFCLLEFEPKMLLTGTSENSIGLWNLNNPNDSIHNFNKHLLWVNCLVKCDEKFFASASNDANIFIWDYYNKICVAELLGHTDCILALIKLNDGNLCSGSADNTIKIWDWKNRCCMMELKSHTKWVKCLCQLKDGTLLSGSDDKTIKIWQKYQCSNTLEGHRHAIRGLCQIDDNHFASASFDNSIMIWDINTKTNIQTLKEHKSNVICIIKLKDNRLASSSSDMTIKIWE